MSPVKGFRTFAKFTFIISLLIICLKYWIDNKTYLFGTSDISDIVKDFVGRKCEDSYKWVHYELKERYNGHILPREDLQWIFVNTGGWMGSMCILHASLTEYVLFLGTAIDNRHTGRYWANVTDFIVSGTYEQWTEGQITSNIYHEGETVHHKWGEASAISWPAGTWTVQYGRGFMPFTLGSAFCDSLFGTSDLLTLFYILRIYTKAFMQEIAFSFTEFREFLRGVD